MRVWNVIVLFILAQFSLSLALQTREEQCFFKFWLIFFTPIFISWVRPLQTPPFSSLRSQTICPVTLLYQYIHSGPGDRECHFRWLRFLSWLPSFFSLSLSFLDSACARRISQMINQILNSRLPNSPQVDAVETYPTRLIGALWHGPWVPGLCWL